uniref:DUF7870 domain-containing protein n=1 Tax=Leersia perrieri TaxID=77586 RepID=A0A0D9X1L2_9ORYZ
MAMMKKSAAREGRRGASNGRNRLLLRRLSLLAVMILSLASLMRALSPPASGGVDGGELYLPVLLAELSDRGYLRHGSRAMFVGDAGSWASFLERRAVAAVSSGELRYVADESVDAVIFDGDSVDFLAVNRVLDAGGVAAGFATSESILQRLPDDYKTLFAHRSSEATIAFAVEKSGAAAVMTTTTTASSPAVGPHRRLLAFPGSNDKKDALAGLEAVLLEPPQRHHRRRIIRRLRPRFLPELTGDSLGNYRRRTFIDVALHTPSPGAVAWFMKHYPKGNHEFEIVRLDAAAAATASSGGEAAAEGIGEWLERNVRKEDYVVVKAGVEAVEEILRKRAAVRRIDELFLDCDAAARRPYWECLALYGRLRDHGVAVHQWWELTNA